MSLPHATLVRQSACRHLVRQLGRWFAERLRPPRALVENVGFAAASHWSVSGALAAGVAVGMYVLLISGTIWEASLPLTVGWAIFAIFGVVFWFWPFLASYYMYAPIARLGLARSRLGAGVYGAVWHMAAHMLLIGGLGSELLTTALVAPAAVGCLWGSWLPAAVARSSR